MAVNNIQSVVYMSEWRKYDKHTPLSYSHFHLKAKLNHNGSMIVNTEFIPTKYFDLIKRDAKTVTLSDVEFIEYKFQPKKYCYDRLGSVELWPILLRLNNMCSAAEFTYQTFKVPGPNIMSVLNEILILESNNIDKNNTSIE